MLFYLWIKDNSVGKEDIRKSFNDLFKSRSKSIEDLKNSNLKDLFEVGLEEYDKNGNYERLDFLFKIILENGNNKELFDILSNFTYKFHIAQIYLIDRIDMSVLSFKQRVILINRIAENSQYEDLDTQIKARTALYYLYQEDKIRFLFYKSAEEIDRDTGIYSDLSYRFKHPAYRKIIRLGKQVLPYIFEELKEDPDWWFYALEAITGEDPTDESMAGRLDLLSEAWLKWAEKNGYNRTNK